MTKDTKSKTKSSESLLDAVIKRKQLFRRFPDMYVWRGPCEVRMLIVADGALDFSLGDFGLSTFIHLLQNSNRGYVKFYITLAHLSNEVTDDLVLNNNVGYPDNEELATAENLLIDRSHISRHIKDFCFDRPSDFTPDLYDEVWLFGFETNYHVNNYHTRVRHRDKYPADRLGDAELINLSKHMDRGGGLFATGDHGNLGCCLGGSVKRVRNMRYWNDFPSFSNSEVGMRNERRNDTNQPGRDLDDFSDQNDDIPQLLDLKLYSSWFTQSTVIRYPHPLLCGRFGRIDVLPDHPHEGECRIPTNTNEIYHFDQTQEYPTDGFNQVIPEIIAWSRVLAGIKSGSKDPAVAHSFAAISTYDGHRAKVGRVVCDSTWHHFLNTNLIGVPEEGIPGTIFTRPGIEIDEHKHTGFLSSTSGREALAKIIDYYFNIAVWIAPPPLHECFLRGGISIVTYKERVVEATVVNPDITFDQIELKDFRYIGIHARDVLDKMGTQCQTLHWIIIWIRGIWPELADYIDPWIPDSKKSKEKFLLPIFDIMPIIDTALGGALVAMRQTIPYPVGQFNNKHQKLLDEAATKGARLVLARAMSELDDNLNTLRKFCSTFK